MAPGLTECARGGETAAEAIRWAAKSTLTLSLNLALLTVWVDYAGVPAELAALLNWLLVPVLGYYLTHRWVFTAARPPDGFRGHVKRYIGMITVNNTAKVGNYLIYVALIQLGADYRLAWVAGAGAVFVLTFSANKELWERTGNANA